MSTPLCVGLTGGIGCGKSTVAQLFEALGAGVIDTDAIAHQLTQTDGIAINAIRATFGADYLDASGAMNRQNMRELVFSDAEAKKKLQAILHPLILDSSKILINQLVSTKPYTILMVPLLLESPDFLQLVQRILVVNCSEQNQISRVRLRSALDEKEIRAIIAQQTSAAERIARADDLIQNDGLRDSLKNQVYDLHRQYLNINNKNNN